MRVEILNPLPGGMRFTNPRRAAELVSMGVAVFCGGKLEFKRDAREGRLQRLTERQEFERNQGERVYYWNGSGDPLSMHRPGERRS
jgi:hypothetical protein